MTQIGLRIRDRRLAVGMTQMDFAAALGISASYLNLIEHGRRRVGEKLLSEMARVLKTDLGLLRDAGDPVLVVRLRDIASSEGFPDEDIAQTTDFVTRFPLWAQMVDGLAAQNEVDAHREQLRDLVGRIRSTAQALVETPDMTGDWPRIFIQRIHEDSGALHHALRQSQFAQVPVSPLEVCEDWIARHHEVILSLTGYDGVAQIVAQADVPEPARKMLSRHLNTAVKDAATLPNDVFLPAARALDWNPVTLSESLASPVAQILRRIADISVVGGGPHFGLLVVDSVGNILRRKRLAGVPLIGPLCARWPIFSAQVAAGGGLRQIVQIKGGPLLEVISHADQVSNWSPRAPDRVMIFRVVKDTMPVDVTIDADCDDCHAHS